MVYTAEYAREKHPDAVNVFISPCPSKKAEAREHEKVDFVWTFRELDAVLDGMEISIDDCQPFTPEESAGVDAHGFAKTGGVFTAVKNILGGEDINGIVISDLNKKNIAVLKAYAKGKCPGKMVEVMSCPGGCITGPCSCADSNEANRRFDSEIKKR